MTRQSKKGILSTPYGRGTRAVSNPPAQSAIVLQMDKEELTIQNVLLSIAQSNTSRFGVYCVGVDLMLSGGLRLSELINAPMLFVNNMGQVLIKGRKGSADKLVSPIYQAEYWRSKAGWLHNPFADVSRWCWYRFFRAQGVCLSEKGHKHNSVTHAPRKLQAHSLFNAGCGVECVRDVMGHRSERSTLYYAPDVMEKEKVKR